MFCTVNITCFASWVDEIAKSRPDMNIKVTAFTESEKWSNTIIDFNEVDIRIYLPEKVIIHRGC